MEEQGDQRRALLDLAAALDAHDISFALIGDIAVGIHSGEPRATIDIDIAVPTTTARSKVAAALQAGGFAAGGAFEHSLNFRHQNGEPIQVAFDPSFDEAIGRAERFDIGGTALRVVRKDDLIAMKERAAGDPARRPSKALRDRADVELLLGDVAGQDEGW